MVELTPPHDVLTREISDYLPKEEVLRYMMEASYKVLKNHPINIKRKEQGLNPANCCWFWGAGTKPMLDNFYTKTGKRGAMISAVDLLKGIAIGAGMQVIEVEGANGGLNTNYTGKKDAAVKALLDDENDFVYIHVEAPDEMGHQGSFERKIKAIENIDAYIVGPLVEELQGRDVEYILLVLHDHPTPVRLRTHTSDAVPYMLYDSTIEVESNHAYSEKEAKETGNYFDEGYMLMNHFLELE